ncbi:30S ribosomal protein S3 [Candidatus Saccharibacteria bacterium QS_8_54_8]|nr:MAG: 30S ribosomal protein S3 [Candidatus Saccharibacteria bacterium QS_8_54_8]
MGHKVNPTSFRLPLQKDWQSKWIASKQDYARAVAEDMQIRQLIQKHLGRRAAIDRIEIQRSPGSVDTTIYTARPGVVIGRGGGGVEELKQKLATQIDSPLNLNIEEVKQPELRAQLVADNIANQLEKRTSFRRAIKSASDSTMRAGAQGVKISVSGRLNGADMARTQQEVEGSIPLHTLRAEIDYAQADAVTTYGTIGVKVWIYRGEV